MPWQFLKYKNSQNVIVNNITKCGKDEEQCRRNIK